MRFMEAAKEKSEKAVRPYSEAAFCINRAILNSLRPFFPYFLCDFYETHLARPRSKHYGSGFSAFLFQIIIT
jgi:hypothetical protein